MPGACTPRIAPGLRAVLLVALRDQLRTDPGLAERSSTISLQLAQMLLGGSLRERLHEHLAGWGPAMTEKADLTVLVAQAAAGYRPVPALEEPAHPAIGGLRAIREDLERLPDWTVVCSEITAAVVQDTLGIAFAAFSHCEILGWLAAQADPAPTVADAMILTHLAATASTWLALGLE
jgi:hypothetical protein